MMQKNAQSYIKKVDTGGKSLEELIADVHAWGWIVNNLFEVGNPKFWRCNVAHINAKTGKITSEYADAYSPEEAVAAAIFDIKQQRNAHTQKPGVGPSASHSDVLGIAAADSPMLTPIPRDARETLEKAFAELAGALKTYWPEFDDQGRLEFFLSF
jgi:hypothetical protein